MCANGLDLDICQSKPDNYDWKSMGEIKLLEDDRSGLSADDLDPEELLKAKRWIAKAGWGFTLLIVVIYIQPSLAGEERRRTLSPPHPSRDFAAESHRTPSLNISMASAGYKYIDS